MIRSVFLTSVVLGWLGASIACSTVPNATDSPATGGVGGEAYDEAMGGRDTSGGVNGSSQSGGAGGEPVQGSAGGTAGGGVDSTGGRTAPVSGGMGVGGAGGVAISTGGTGGVGDTAGSIPEVAEGAGVFFSGKQPNIAKMVPGDTKPGYMSLTNGVTVQSHQDIPIAFVSAMDPGLPRGTQYAMEGNTPKPGAVNLIWSVNFRADSGGGATRADWQGFDTTAFAGFEFYIKTSHIKKYRLVFYSGTTGNKSTGDLSSPTSWKRVRIGLPSDLRFGPGPLNLSDLGRLDFVMSVENNNPPLQWAMTAVRFLTAAQLAEP